MGNIPADIVHDTTKDLVLMKKSCKKHGEFEDILSRTPEEYIWKNGFTADLNCVMETMPDNIELNESKNGCPYDCGLCERHKSATNCMIIDITNRCNLNCPICFANANKKGRIVEYTREEVYRIMKHFIEQKPYFAAIAQFSGGEPTLHPDIIPILQDAKDIGFPHRMLNTNGIKMAKSLEFCRQLKEVDCGAIYLSLSSFNPEASKAIRGVDVTKIKRKVIENCREVGLDGIMLVVTLAKGQNDNEIQEILEFGRDNNDVIAGIVYQPVSLCGRITLEDLKQLRYTNSDLTKEIRRCTDGQIDKFYPLSISNKLTQLITWFGNEPGWSISAHDDCGWATLAQIVTDEEGNKSWKSLEDYADIEGLTKWSNEVWDLVEKREIPKPSSVLSGITNNPQVKNVLDTIGLGKAVDTLIEFNDQMTDIAYRSAIRAYFLAGAAKFIKNPKSFNMVLNDKFYMNVAKLLFNPGLSNSKGMLMNGTFFIGSMHFQDAYNFDLDRVERCVVHYGALDPKDPNRVLQIPFCSFNTIHREPIETEWAKTHGKALDKTPEQHAKEVKALSKEISTKK
ncbi:MAG: radical SAM protein [archaeon]|nr:radical SAM protein [archaeon]